MIYVIFNHILKHEFNFFHSIFLSDTWKRPLIKMQWDIAIGMDNMMTESFQFILHLYSTICVKPPPYCSYTKHKTGWLAKSDNYKVLRYSSMHSRVRWRGGRWSVLSLPVESYHVDD